MRLKSSCEIFLFFFQFVLLIVFELFLIVKNVKIIGVNFILNKFNYYKFFKFVIYEDFFNFVEMKQ